MKIGARLFVCTAFLALGTAKAQDTIYPVSDLVLKKSFVYQLVKNEYITNENDYYIANTVDTNYLTFINTGEPLVFKVKTSMDEEGKVPIKNQDTLRRLEPIIEFTPTGKVKMLKNWTLYRDLMVSFYSAQVRASEITPSEFKEMKDKVNKEENVRRMVIEDINYLFYLSGDTFHTDIEYLRMKAVRSPLSDADYYFIGNLKVMRMPGTKNTVMFYAKNKADASEKQMLMQEAKAYLRKKTPKTEPVSEITAVGLNSEQEYQYNLVQKRMVRVTFSDVLVLDMSSRGNIRIFTLWKIE